MNIFLPLSDKDEEYKTYYRIFKTTANLLVGEGKKERYSDWMKQVVRKFPFFEYTNARVMAVASVMSTTGESEFNPNKAREYLKTVFREVKDKDNLDLLVISVDSYFERLRS